MTLYSRRGLVVLLHEVSKHFDVIVCVLTDGGFVEVEFYVQLNPYSLHHRLGLRLSHRCRLNRFNHGDSLLLGAIGPAVGCSHAATNQCAITCVGAAFYRAQRGAGYAANSRAAGPILFLHPCAAGQKGGHHNHGYCCP